MRVTGSATTVRYLPFFRVSTDEIHVVEVVATGGVDDRVVDEVRRQAAAWARGGVEPRIVFGPEDTQDRSLHAPVGRALRVGPALSAEGMTEMLRRFPVANP